MRMAMYHSGCHDKHILTVGFDLGFSHTAVSNVTSRLLQPVNCVNLCYVLFSVQDDMNLTEERKAPLRGKRLDEKRELLAMQFKGSIQVDAILCVYITQQHVCVFISSFSALTLLIELQEGYLKPDLQHFLR